MAFVFVYVKYKCICDFNVSNFKEMLTKDVNFEQAAPGFKVCFSSNLLDFYRCYSVYLMQDRSNQAKQNKDGTFPAVGFGKTLFCGDSMRDREVIAARTFPVCILIEGKFVTP